MINVNLDKAMATGSNYRFEAIRIVHPTVVTLRGENDARDQQNNVVTLDEAKIAVEVARMTQEADEAKAIAEAKAAKIQALEELTVTTTNGNEFDANADSITNMLAAVEASAILGTTENSWKLADNSIVTISLDELKEALAKSIQAKGTIILGA